MSLTNLSAKEMLGLSGAWLDPARSRKTLANSRRTASLLDDLQSAHDTLVGEIGSTPEEPSKELAAVLTEQLTQDAIHDRKARGTSLVLEGLAELADLPEQREVIASATRALFPEGLTFINLSYPAEVGNVEATEKRFEKAPQVQMALKKTSTPWGTKLLDEVHAWFEAGHELAKLDTKRHHLTASAAPAKATGAARFARNRWLAVVNAMLSNIALDTEVDADVERDVRSPLREAAARADERSSRRKKPSGPEESTPDDGSGGEKGSSGT